MEFEFETPRRNEQQQQQLHKQDQVPMVYADELFYNGQFLPLKPPPRLQYVSNQTTSVSSPTSPRSILKGPFRRWSFNKNDENDFDPFMVALEKVKNEASYRDQNGPHKRTRSLSPMRSPSLWPNSNDSMGETGSQQPAGSYCAEKTYPEKSVLGTPASRMRSRHKRPVKPTLTTLPGHRVKTPRESDIKRDGPPSSRKGSKRFNIKDIMFGDVSEGRTNSDKKLGPHTGALRRPPELRDLSLKAIQKAHCTRQKDLGKRELRKTLLPYKVPRMLVCLGLGNGGLRDLN